MKLEIVQIGEEVLRQPARALTREDIESDSIRELIANMHETLRAAPGVGLAAPQVGLPIRLAIIEDLPEYAKDTAPEQFAERERQPVPFHVIVNPEIVRHSAEQVEFFEGCLSVAGFTALVPRFRKVSVRCLNEHGEQKILEASGWYARILQHEIDHLNGTVYVDRMSSTTFMTLDNFTQRWKNKPIEEIKRRFMSSEGAPA